MTSLKNGELVNDGDSTSKRLDDIETDIKALIKRQAESSFVEGYKPSDAEVLGLILAHALKWDGIKIANAAYNAFEDANFHTFNKEFAALLEKHGMGVE